MTQLTKRRLTDLWVIGRTLTLDDGDGEVTVWLQKMNAIESSEATRRCDAARARILATKGGDDNEWQAVLGTVREYGDGDREKIIEFLLTVEKRDELVRSHEARLANEEEWSKDNYIQGLYDAWREGLERRWLEDNNDKEAASCKAELDRFSAQVAEEVESEIDLLRDAWSEQPLVQLEDRMAQKLLEMDAGQAWMNELWACQLYYGVRDSDHKKERYFVSRDEVDALAPRAFEALHQAYADLEVDVAEGKGSPAPTPSSPSSVEQNAVATGPSSGPLGASR